MRCRQQGGGGAGGLPSGCWFTSRARPGSLDVEPENYGGGVRGSGSTDGTREYRATLPQPRRSHTQNISQGWEGRLLPLPHGAPVSLQRPARGIQVTGPVPAANDGGKEGTSRLCPQEPHSLCPPHHGCIIIRNCTRPAPVGLARWHVRGSEASFDALDSL